MRSPLWILIAVLAAGPAFAEPYRCELPDGSIALRDTPCPAGSQQAPRVQPAPASPAAAPAPGSWAPRPTRVVRVPIPSVGTARLAELEGWRAKVVQNEGAPPTFELTSLDPADPAVVLLTFMPNKERRRLDAGEFVDTTRKLLSLFLEDSVEQQVELKVLETQLGKSLYATFTDRRLQHAAELPPGEFRNVTAGLIWHSHVIINYTILNNGLDRDSRRVGFLVVSSFLVAPDAPGGR